MPSLGLGFPLPFVPVLSGPIQTVTCVDVVGQPAINVVDFFGQTGANYVTGGQGKWFNFFDTFANTYAPWFNTGTESSPSAPGTKVQVFITPTSQPSDIAAAAVSALTGVSPYTVSVINGGGTNSALQITQTSNANCVPAVDGNTGAAFSQTQLGYPSGHYCTPGADALAGISFAARFQCTYLGVGMNSSVNGGLGGPTYTTKDLNGNPMLFTDVAMTMPAVNQGDVVAAWKDPISGLAATQSTSIQRPVLNFSINALGIWVPYLACVPNDQLTFTAFYPGTNWSAMHVVQRPNPSNLLIGFCHEEGAVSGDPYSLLAFSDGNIYASTQAGNAWIGNTDTTWNFWQVNNTSNVLAFLKNGTPQTISGTGSATVTKQWNAMFGNSGQGRFSTGSYSAIMVAGSVISLTTQQQQYLESLAP